MNTSTSILSAETIESPGFLDALLGQLQEYSLSRYDAASGGFCSRPESGPTVMGATDVVWFRYASNQEDIGAPNRDRLVEFLRAQQDSRTGMVVHTGEDGHAPGHAFWQTVRALRILRADLAHFPEYLRPRCTPDGINKWFDSFNWDTHDCERPGNHHEVLGMVPLAVSLGNKELVETIFQNLGKQQNAETGFWPRSGLNISRTFAYTALHLATGRIPNMPEMIIDAILDAQNETGFWCPKLPSFHTMDSAFVLIRLPGLIGDYREPDAVAALERLSLAMRSVYAAEQHVFF